MLLSAYCEIQVSGIDVYAVGGSRCLPEKLNIQVSLSISSKRSCTTGNPIRPNVMWKHRRLAALMDYKANDVATDGNNALGRELWSLRVRETCVVVSERMHSPVIHVHPRVTGPLERLRAYTASTIMLAAGPKSVRE